MTMRTSLILALCLLAPSLASATNVPLPDDMCALDASKPEHSLMINFMRGTNAGYNQVLASFAPCDELEAIAKKKATALTHYGSVLGQETPSNIPTDRVTYLAHMTNSYQQSSKTILHQDPRMVMSAVAQTNPYGGAPVPIATTTSTTLVGTTQLLLTYNAPQAEDADFSKGKELLIRYTNQIIRANP